MGHHYVGLVAVGTWFVLGTFVGPVGFVVFNVCPIKSPHRVSTSVKCLFAVVFFLFEQISVVADSLCSVFQSVGNTK